MESLVNYESDEDNENINIKRNQTTADNPTNNRRDSMESFKGGLSSQRRDDSNCDNITMDLSEGSSESSDSSHSDVQDSRKRQAGDAKSIHKQNSINNLNKHLQNREKKSKNGKRSLSPQRSRNEKDDKTSRTEQSTNNRSLDYAQRDKNNKDRDHDRLKYEDRDRDRLKYEDRDRNKHRDSKYERDSDSSRRSDKDRKRYREESRSKSHRERDSHRHHEGRSYRRRSRSRSRSRSGSRSRERHYRLDKAAQKRQLLEKLGIELQPSDTSGGSYSVGDILTGAANSKSLELPKYYNPGVINPAKYAQQMQKRKLLWGNKSASDVKTDNKESDAGAKPGSSEQNVIPSNSNSSSTSHIPAGSAVAKWTNTRFAQDADGKVASKFMRLMGIKDAAKPPANVVPTEDVIKKQEEMFSTMEQQYEVARTVTHTMRGMGLGFGRQF